MRKNHMKGTGWRRHILSGKKSKTYMLMMAFLLPFLVQAQTWTPDYLQKCMSGGPNGPNLTNSLLYDNGINLGLGTTTPLERLDVDGNIRSSGMFISALTGSPPLSVASDLMVTNLNSDMLDGKHSSWFSASTHLHNGMVTGSGSAQKISWWNSANSITSDPALVWDNSLKFMGIGVSSPLAGLHIGAIGPASIILQSFPQGQLVSSQWMVSNNIGNMMISSNGYVRAFINGQTGRVGIGTLNPGQMLEVAGGIKAGNFYGVNLYTTRVQTQLLLITPNAVAGNVLICNPSGYAVWTSPAVLMDNDWTISSQDVSHAAGRVSIGTNNFDGGKLNIQTEGQPALIINSIAAGYGYAQITRVASNNTTVLRVENVSLPVNDQVVFELRGDGFLVVDNNIKAKEVEVKINVWQDAVFEKDYPLFDIPELENYIQLNKHLPGVPSEKEVLENGIKVGEMNSTLLQKIEELTLYIIDLQKQINELEINQNR